MRKNKTREERRAALEAVLKVAFVVLILLFLMLLLVVLAQEPDIVPTVAQERAAQYYASQEYDRMLSVGASEWSAQQAAEAVYRERMEVDHAEVH